MENLDFQRIARELVRALRGSRTQKALSRALGYRTNVLFSWESGRDQIPLRAFLRLLGKLRRDPRAWLSDFGRGPLDGDPLDPEIVGRYARQISSGRGIGELALALGISRYVLSRWLSGKTEFTLSDFLAFVETTTLASLDLVALLTDPLGIPSARLAYERLEAARLSARENPWSHAIAHMVELPSYRALKCHQPGFFASRLHITTDEERSCLDLLLRLGRIIQVGDRYESSGAIAVDTRPAPDTTRKLAAFWMREGARRVENAESGRFAFNTFCVSQSDLERLRELQSKYFRELRSIVASSEPTEVVAVATFQLFPLAVET